MKGPITTHVLDLASGHPAAGVAARLEMESEGAWRAIGDGRTDEDGRINDLVPHGAALRPGVYRLTFETGEYHRAAGRPCFHPRVTIEFEVGEARHHHVPLLLSPFGYSTYRGS